jgi:hypothetical protein
MAVPSSCEASDQALTTQLGQATKQWLCLAAASPKPKEFLPDKRKLSYLLEFSVKQITLSAGTTNW